MKNKIIIRNARINQPCASGNTMSIYSFSIQASDIIDDIRKNNLAVEDVKSWGTFLENLLENKNDYDYPSKWSRKKVTITIELND